MSEYLLNKETQKIELHFDKADYMALAADQKKSIKSAFLWSSRAGAWVSRSKNNHYRPIEIAKSLGLTDAGSVGERLSYAEELEVKADKAANRAERYEVYADNAVKRAKQLQSDFNEYRKDWSWLTQPVIAGHRGSQAFARHRGKVIARYERGLEEYNKSDYYKKRATTARATAKTRLNDKVYIDTRIKESQKTMKKLQENIVTYENYLYRIEQGEKLTRYNREPLTASDIEGWIEKSLEDYDWHYDKVEFLETCMDDLGGVQFSKDNIKKGDFVTLKRWDRVEVVGKGSVNITYKILTGGAAGLTGKAPYAAIINKC